MKDLLYLLRRMSGLELAKLIGIESPNLSIWKKNKHIPKKHLEKLKKIKKETK